MRVLNKSMYPHQISWPKTVSNEEIDNRVRWIRSKLGNENWNFTDYHVVFVNSQDAMMYALRWSS
jgi:hypothetical protein